MTTKTDNSKKWLLGISIFAIIWNAMGVNMYLQQAYKTDSFKAMYQDPKILEMVENTPSWVMGAFAIAVFAGVIGSLLLLLKKKLAKSVLLISLIAVLAQMTYNVFISGAMEVYGPGAVIMPIVTLVFSFFLYWYSKKVDAKGILT
ncbi:hypothetical protein OD91_0258 [Lutibacter sp. Hel_I_33_5]|uniref:hypothetical protein n=1 Tax=Lutibacter sp. Hel_I_33_5 TaxID=1566289 RepID=UPI00119FB072|nr:hypothetical protein [Lutibacter sp. Hel_I_33_5]TVZ55017.1 hypothetical protein OD91_0258 [Lutibacter sp. Hel_I_33_5]